MFDWVVNAHQFMTIFSFGKRSEKTDKQSSDILLEQTQTQKGPISHHWNTIMRNIEKYNYAKENKVHSGKSYLKYFYIDYKWIYIYRSKSETKK